jgi:F-type H+-transporting ATPase subunit b
VKMIWRRSLLGGLLLALVLGVGFRLRAVPVNAQATHDAASSAAPSPEKQSDLEVDENDAYLHSPMVTKMGAMVGMNAGRSATVFQFTNFALLVLFLGWALVKILPKLLRTRTETIQKNLVDARTATEEARGRLSAVEERLSKLDGEIAGMRAKSDEDSVRDEQRIKRTVEEEKQNILAAAEQEIAAATMRAQKQLQQHAAELAIEQAARKLVVSAETDRLLVQSFAQRLTGDESKKGQN